MLSVTRVASYRPSCYFDFENKITVQGNYSSNLYYGEVEIMKTNFYLNDNDAEVVETSIYHFGVDNLIHSNEEEKQYNKNIIIYPYQYIYLKNVEDKSLLKYHIKASKYYTNYELQELFSINVDDGARDIRGLTPYGYDRSFLIADYDGYNVVETTEINQEFETLTTPGCDGVVDFDMSSENIKTLVKEAGITNDFMRASVGLENIDDIIEDIDNAIKISRS